MRCIVFLLTLGVHAETGRDAWLRYAPLATPPDLPAVVSVSGDSPIMRAAREELIRGVQRLTGRILRAEAGSAAERAIQLRSGVGGQRAGGYSLETQGGNIVVSAGDDRGI